MNIAMMQEVIRISDRFMDRRDPDSIDRPGQLASVLVVVFIVHALMLIAFLKLEELERKHPRIIHDVDVQFVFQAPPPVPSFKVGEVPKPISLTEGDNPNPGSAAAKPQEASKLTLPTVKAPEALTPPATQVARPAVSHKTTVAPPVMVTPTNTIKAAPIPIAKLPSPPIPNPVTGQLSTSTASGSLQNAGAPGSNNVGTGNKNEGVAGQGTGPGSEQGTGSGPKEGGQIATVLPNIQRAKGNIGPYRKDLLKRIAQNWHPKKRFDNIVVLAEIGHDGKLLRAELIGSSGNKKADREAVDAIEATEFAPLPDWYKGESIPFKIELAQVEAAQ
ncbi:MAG: TonB family protein [Candidatus Obscuribacterales bacterium]|nr:TonB family protein [Candidatus Obscuribacterales bacterium]